MRPSSCSDNRGTRSQLFSTKSRFAGLAALALACGSPPEPVQPQEAWNNVPLTYSFGSVDGTIVDSEQQRGRVTVLFFFTTFDLVSQAQAKRLEDLARQHVPRLNALGVALEPPRNADLVRTFGATVGLHFPLALADADTMAGQGPFGSVRAVPTWLLLDKKGRVRSSFVGAMNPAQLDEWVAQAE